MKGEGKEVQEEDQGETSSKSNNCERYYNELVRVNVGGIHYDFGATLLEHEEDSMLAALCGNALWKDRRRQDESGRIFIDRDGKRFRYILDYLRGGKDVLEDVPLATLKLLLLEAQYFALSSMHWDIEWLLISSQHGTPISFQKDAWVRVQGHAANPDAPGTWAWSKQSGNVRLLKKKDWQWTVQETGMYLMMIRLFYVPHFRTHRGEQYTDRTKDELLTVEIENQSFGAANPEIIARFGSFDYWSQSEAVGPSCTATATCCELVHLMQGDDIRICYHERIISYVRVELPPKAKRELVDSFTLIQVSGTAASKFYRLPHLPKSICRGNNSISNSMGPSSPHPHHGQKSRWRPVERLFSSNHHSLFQPILSDEASSVTPPVAGIYLLFGRFSIFCDSNSLDLDLEQDAWVQVVHPTGRVFRTFPAFSNTGMNLCGTARLLDLAYLEPGYVIEACTMGNVEFDDHGIQDPSGKHPWQGFTMMLLSPKVVFDRYHVTCSPESDDIMWVRSIVNPYQSSSDQVPPMFDIEQNALLFNNNNCGSKQKETISVLVMATFPALVTWADTALFVDGTAIAVSRNDTPSGEHHSFCEVIQVRKGTKLTFCMSTANLQGEQTAGIGLFEYKDYSAKYLGHLCAIVLEDD